MSQRVMIGSPTFCGKEGATGLPHHALGVRSSSQGCGGYPGRALLSPWHRVRCAKGLPQSGCDPSVAGVLGGPLGLPAPHTPPYPPTRPPAEAALPGLPCGLPVLRGPSLLGGEVPAAPRTRASLPASPASCLPVRSFSGGLLPPQLVLSPWGYRFTCSPPLPSRCLGSRRRKPRAL